MTYIKLSLILDRVGRDAATENHLRRKSAYQALPSSSLT